MTPWTMTVCSTAWAPAARPPAAAGDDARAALGDHRHLGEHAVPAGVRAAETDAGAAAAAVPGPPGAARRAGRCTVGRRPAGAPAADRARWHDHVAVDPPARRGAGVPR